MKRSVGVVFLVVPSLSAPSALAQTAEGGAPTPIQIDPSTCPLLVVLEAGQ